MATVNEGQNNVILSDVLITDTLPGSAATNSILNPLSSSNRQNIGVSSSIADSKNQLATEADQLSAAIAPPKSSATISDSSSNKSDDSLIVPDPLNSGLSESISRSTLPSNSDAESKDTLTGSSKNTSLIAPKEDTLTTTDPLTNNKIAPEKSSAIDPAKLAKTEQKSATETAKNNTIAEPKETAIAVATKSEDLTAQKTVTTTNISKDSQKENPTASSGENDKKVVENSQYVAVEAQKELDQTAPKSLPVADNSFTSGKFVVDSTGQVGIDFLYDGGLYKGQLAIISLKGMEKFVPGSTEFIKEAAARALSNSVTGHIAIDDLSEGARFTGNLAEGNYNDGNYAGVKSFAMTPGEEFGIAIVPNGTFQEVLNNPAVGGDKRPLFSMTTANPAEGFHVGQIADVTGSGKTFTMEDMRVDLGSDRDYNDFIFQVRGATGKAVLLDEVINAEKDWRKADIGKSLIAYSQGEIVSEKPKTLSVKTDDTQPTAKPLETVTEKTENPAVKTNDTQATDKPLETITET
ncbi:MAG: DUF4114 domain-containing protein, partial [Microcoleus sp. CSU_2_2]|nr:DUF4114 domain-containing protein [Microcoleus sp. SU_5_3]NJS10949.1 DUF4114 domain-containing protein [Microcoleus sp. CSU_2_2]